MDALISFLAFPLNLIFAILWLAGCVMLYSWARKSAIVRFLLSPAASVSAIGLFLIACIWIGISGDREFTSSAIFVVILFYLQTVLLMVILRGWKGRVRFTLLHCGLLLALGAAFWGAPDSETFRVKAGKGVVIREVYRIDGTRDWLSYDVELVDLKPVKSGDGQPEAVEAELVVDGQRASVSVNRPYPVSLAEDIYITGYEAGAGGDSTYCVLQIVREPWKYFALAGIIMLMAGAMLLFLKGPEKRCR